MISDEIYLTDFVQFSVHQITSEEEIDGNNQRIQTASNDSLAKGFVILLESRPKLTRTVGEMLFATVYLE